MKIGAMELVVIFIVALLVIGPDKLPQYARKFGAAMREFRKASQGVTQELRESVIDPLEDISKGLKSDLNAVEKDLKNIGKSKPQETKPAAPADEKTAPAEEKPAPAEAAAPTDEAQADSARVSYPAADSEEKQEGETA